jgi:hypothetical protein
LAARLVTGSKRDTFFFLHVMKTAGSTFTEHLTRNFQSHEMYPQGDGSSGAGAYFGLRRLAELTASERENIRLYRGHFPFEAAVAYGARGQVMITILREPVARVISLLSREQQVRQPDRSFEEIYADPLYFERFAHNHMTKVFAMRLDDAPLAYFSPIQIDRDRLEAAKENLQRIDVLGFQDRLGEMTDELRVRFGWRIDQVTDQKVSEPVAVSDGLRARIARDNALDVEFYEFARERRR